MPVTHTTATAAPGGTRAHPSRRTAFVAVAVLLLLICTTVRTQQRAYALALPPLPVSLPASLYVEAGAVAEGTATGAVAVGTAPAWVPVAVGALAAGAVAYGIDKAVSWAFHWGSGHTSHAYAEPAIAGGLAMGASVTVNGIHFANEPQSSLGQVNDCGQWWNNGCWAVVFSGGTGTGHAMTIAYSGSGYANCTDNCGRLTGHTGPLYYYDGSGTLVAQITPCGMGQSCAAGSAGNSDPTVRTIPHSVCKQVSGGATSDVVSTIVYDYKASDANPPTMVEPACDPGWVRIGGSFPTTDPATGATAAPPVKDWSVTVPGGFSQCQDLGHPCVLNLFRVGTGTGAGQQTCSNSAACTGWQTQARPTGATRTVKTAGAVDVSEPTWTYPDGDHLDCYFGPYLMQTTECSTVPTEPAAGTGTGTGTSTGGDPNSGANDCWPSGWSSIFRPDEWVLQPIKCALRWAFVPSNDAVNTDLATMRSGWNNSGVSTWATAAGGIFTGIAGLGSSGDGCAGPHFTITLGGHGYAFDPFNACQQPMQGVAVVVKLFITLWLVIYGGRKLVRTMLTAFGMGGAI